VYLKRKEQNRWLLIYTGMFLCGLLALCFVMMRYDKTLVWAKYSADGLKQNYTVMGYVGQVLRTLLNGEGYQMINFSLGQGFDTLTTMTYYGYTDPLNLLGFFAKENSIEVVHTVVNFLRMYLTGVFCALYIRKMGAKDQWALACGAMIYAFAGYSVWMAGRYPYFLNGALYLPLFLLGIEKIFENRSWLLYTFVAMLMLVVNFYFAYMNTMAAIAYIVIRLCFRIRKRGIKESAKDGFLLVGAYLLGAALSAIVFFPIIKVFFGSGRIGVEAGYQESMVHYGLKHYVSMFVSAFAPWEYSTDFLLMNYSPLALFGVLALLFVRDRKATQVRIGLIGCAVGVGIPVGGYIMNGAAYVSNRWIYILGFFIAFGSTLGLQALFSDSGSLVKKVAGLALVYSVAVFAILVKLGQMRAVVGPLFVWMFAIAMLVYDRGCLKKMTVRHVRMLTALFLAGTSMVYAMVIYMPHGYNYIAQQAPSKTYDMISNSTAGNLVEDEGIYRIGQGGYDDAQAMLLGYMGTSFYWSLVDSEISAYYRDLGLPGQRFSYNVETLGGSGYMNTVAAVRYYVRNEGQKHIVPYGFERVDDVVLPNGKKAEVYKNAYDLALGYAYDQVMSKETYDKLPVESKMQALLKYAICDIETALPVIEEKLESKELKYRISALSDVNLTDSMINAKKGGVLEFEFKADKDYETFLIIEGVEIIPDKSNTRGTMTVESENGIMMGYLPSPNNNFYYPKENLAFCLGEGEIDSCKITFNSKKNYSYDRIRIVSIPLSEYRMMAEIRKSESLTNVLLSNNCINGEIVVEGDRILQIAVPYSDGWTAWVDGEKRELFRCGGMYMGLDLDAGTHEIELRYVTPGLLTGAVVSAAALMLVIVLVIAGKKKQRRREL